MKYITVINFPSVVSQLLDHDKFENVFEKYKKIRNIDSI